MTPQLFPFVLALVLSVVLLSSVPILVMFERWGSAWMQRRIGPNRVGPFGLLQPLSDAIKLVFKEENIPLQAHKVLFLLAPALAVIPPFFAFSVIPISGSFFWKGNEYLVGVSNLNVGLLFLLAITSLHVFSVLAAGWSSNNKFSLMGALRASAQMISYEIAIGINIVSVVMMYGTLNLREIVKLQEAGSSFPLWGAALQPLAFIMLWVASFAETNRLPFDLPEGESELVAGYHTEYSGLKFGLFMMGEYVAMILASAFLVTLFWGGYNIPFLNEVALRELISKFGFTGDLPSILAAGAMALSFIVKVAGFMWVFIWVRWTLPRFRYDQLMDLGWKIMFPLGIANVILTMIVTYILRRNSL